MSRWVPVMATSLEFKFFAKTAQAWDCGVCGALVPKGAKAWLLSRTAPGELPFLLIMHDRCRRELGRDMVEGVVR